MSVRKRLEMIHAWTETEKAASLTWQESQAVFLFLQVHSERLKNEKIKWYSDNQGVPAVLHKGSMVAELNLCSMKILQICLEHSIKFP